MDWITIASEQEVEQIHQSDEYAIIYKHSPKCMTSLMAFRRLKSEADPNFTVPMYMVDVIRDRPVSLSIANAFKIRHESPQVLIVKNGECVYNASHESVSLKAMIDYIRKES